MKPINTSTFDYPTFIQQGFVYVDKTAQIYKIARPGTDGIYFFPRPRRFGKSLLISTFKALFLGRRELFKGLAIKKTDWNWKNEIYRVLHLDMSDASCLDEVELNVKLNLMMEARCAGFGVAYGASVPPSGIFAAFADNPRPVFYVGVNYSPRKNIRAVNDVKCELFQQSSSGDAERKNYLSSL